MINPFTPKSDQFQISPAASPVILHHIVWRIWLFIALLRCKIIILSILTTSLYYCSFKGCENVLFELGSESVKVYNIQFINFILLDRLSNYYLSINKH